MQPQPQAAQSEYATISSLKERIAKSSVIIQGEITGQGEIINGDRNTSDPTKPASNAFSIGQVYHVRVIRYLKGTGSQTLNIIQVEGVIRREPTAVTRQDIEQARTSYPYLPFQTGTTYMLFLDPFVGTDFTGTYYIGGGGVASPWRFALLPDGTLNAEGPGIGSLAQPGGEFAPRPLADFTAQVTQFVQAEKAATPPK